MAGRSGSLDCDDGLVPHAVVAEPITPSSTRADLRLTAEDQASLIWRADMNTTLSPSSRDIMHQI